MFFLRLTKQRTPDRLHRFGRKKKKTDASRSALVKKTSTLGRKRTKPIDMKKTVLGFAAGAMMLTLLSGTVLAKDYGISVCVDGKEISFDTAPCILNDRTMVPMRGIFEALGASVEWEDAAKTVKATRGERTVSLTVGADKMTVDDKTVSLDTPLVIRDNRTLVPVRAISEALGVSVDWLDEIKTVSVITDKESEKTAVLYDLNHIEKEVDSRLVDRYTAIGYRENLDGLYVELYSPGGKGKIPKDTLEKNIENGWSETAPALELNDKCSFEQKGTYTRVYWNPINRTGKDIVRYTFDIHYITGEAGGYRTVTKNVSGTFKDGEEIGHTTSVAENSYVEFYNENKVKTVIIGEVTVRFAKGDPITFWCGQGAGKNGKWDGSMYDNGLIKLSDNGKAAVVYSVYNTDGKKQIVSDSALSEAEADGWYRTPVTRLYYADGISIVAATDKVENLKKEGLFDTLSDILVEMYSTFDGKTEKVMPQQVWDYLEQGWKRYTEPVTVLYSPTGEQRAFGNSEIPEKKAQGWSEKREDVFVTLYNLSDESIEVLRVDKDGYCQNGWYEMPVVRVYFTTGVDKIIPKDELTAYRNEGWVTDPEEIKITLYRTSGETVRIMPYDLETYLDDDWYTEPVTEVYSADGECAVIRSAEVNQYLSAGWSDKEETFYTDYYTKSAHVRGLKKDKEAYLAAGFRTMPYPITLNTDCYLERASVWSQYTYALYWHPMNTSGAVIDSYRVEYHVPCGDAVYDYSENFYVSVKAGEKLGSNEYSDSFLVTLTEGCDSLIIGNITLRYADGNVETFWCGQRIKLGAESWDGAIYSEKIVPDTNDTDKLWAVRNLKKLNG